MVVKVSHHRSPRKNNNHQEQQQQQQKKKKKHKKTSYNNCIKWLSIGILFILAILPILFQIFVDGKAKYNKYHTAVTSKNNNDNLDAVSSLPWPIERKNSASITIYPRPPPRILIYDFKTNKASSQQISPSRIPKELGPAAESFKIAFDDNNNAQNSPKECKTMHEWQTALYPSCLDAHTINMRPETGSVKFINCGGSRCAFKILDTDGETVVLKVPKYKKDFEPRRYTQARKDGMAMERLHSSPYVLDIYGYCGLSQIIEPGETGGNMHDLIKLTRREGGLGNSNNKMLLSNIDRLKITYQLASAVADMHTFEKDGAVSLTHNDVCCHQFILSHGVYKLNDFHMAHFQLLNVTDHQACKSGNGYNSDYKVIRSPEEIAIKLRMKRGDIVLEKSDVYTLGNVMYYVLTMRWLFEKYPERDACKRIVSGERSAIPDNILESDDRSVQAMKKAVNMCWTHEPNARPTADEIRNFLGQELKALLNVTELGVVRVDNIKSLPTDYSFTSTDYTTMFEQKK